MGSGEDSDISDNTPAPKPITRKSPTRLSVRQKKARIEENLKAKREAKSVKENTRAQANLRKLSKSDKSPEKKKDPFSEFMKEFRQRMDQVDSRLDNQTEKIDGISTRIDRIESHARKQEKINKKEFENIRAEMSSNYASREN